MKFLVKSLQDLFRSVNEFFEMARTGKRITHIAIAIPILIVFFVVAMFASGTVFYYAFQDSNISRTFGDFYQLFFSFGTIIFIVWLWVKFFEKRSFTTIGFQLKGAFKKYMSGFLSGFIMLGVVIGLMAISGVIGFKEKTEPFTMDFFGVMMILLLGYMVQGAAEEVIARGWQFQVIGARYKPWLGAVISSVIFAVLHGLNPGISVISIVNLLLFAFLLIFIILNHGSIWAACGWHTAWNWTMENIYGLKVSGTEGGQSVLGLTAEGPSYITGGGFGPEGSVLTTIVLIAGMIIVLINHSKKKKSLEE